MAFQNLVNIQPSPGIEGGRASDNPIASVVGSFVANSAGVRVGSFAWIAAGLAYSYNSLGALPAGFVMNSQQAFISAWKGRSSMIIPSGVPAQIFDRGDFWAYATYASAVLGSKVFANLFNGKIQTGAAGAFLTGPSGTAGTATGTIATNVFTATGCTIYIAPGMSVTGVGIPVNTYVESQLTGVAGATTAATYNLSTFPGTLASATYTFAANDGIGGAIASSVTAASGSTTLTINTVTSGSIVPGQLVQAIAGIPAGTVVASIGTFNGTTGTIILSKATTAIITAQPCNFSAWIETPFYAKSAGNLGDLIKIGINN